MGIKPKTPTQIAKERQEKKTYSFTLIKENVDQIAQYATTHKVPVSGLIDAAIIYYLEAIKEGAEGNPLKGK